MTFLVNLNQKVTFAMTFLWTVIGKLRNYVFD